MNEAGIERMARLIGDVTAGDRSAGERQVAYDIEHLVSDEFVFEPKALGIHDATGVDHDCVGQ
jgi:hypothetical protein